METNIGILALVFLCFNINVYSQGEKYDYENWPGKSGISKNMVEINDNLVARYQMSLAAGFRSNAVFYKLPLYQGDTLKKGRLQIEIFAHSSSAQLALVDYLDYLVMPSKPPRLTQESFEQGDVAFGNKFGDRYKVAFTRNNVLIILDAPFDIAVALAKEIDIIILNAPEMKIHSQSPVLLFNE